MRLMKMVAILGVGFYFGLQTERGAELGVMLNARYDAFVEHWSQFKALTLPADLLAQVGQPVTR